MNNKIGQAESSQVCLTPCWRIKQGKKGGRFPIQRSCFRARNCRTKVESLWMWVWFLRLSCQPAALHQPFQFSLFFHLYTQGQTVIPLPHLHPNVGQYGCLDMHNDFFYEVNEANMNQKFICLQGQLIFQKPKRASSFRLTFTHHGSYLKLKHLQSQKHALS